MANCVAFNSGTESMYSTLTTTTQNQLSLHRTPFLNKCVLKSSKASF